MNFRRRMENEIEGDIREFIELETAGNIERGMSPDEAHHAALRKFGNVLRTAEETHAVWGWAWAERLAQDLRYSLRGLRRNPMFAAVAILTLALGIGMNTAVFSVVSGVLVKPLPYPDSGRLVWVANYNRRFHFEAATGPDFTDWRKAHAFEDVTAYMTLDSTVQDGSQSTKHSLVAVTPSFWRIAGARPAEGRLFSETDRGVLVLSWRMFQQRFAGDAAALGRMVQVDGRAFRIVGVLPKDFLFLPPSGGDSGMSGDAEAFVPNVITPEMETRQASLQIMFVIAKLKPRVSAGQARSELSRIQERVQRENPAMHGYYSVSELRVLPLQEELVGESRHALLILLAAVALVLLIACANLGNLLLARASARQREIAIRAAIGAGRGRLIRHFLIEGLTLSLLGGAAGLALARAADGVIVRVNPAAVPRLGEVAIDWRVALFTLAVSLLAGMVFGLAPLFFFSNPSLASMLKDGGRGSSAGPAGLRIRRLLVATELALALVLLTGAGLMVKSFVRMYAHPATFQPARIATLKVFLSGPAYLRRAAADAYGQRVLERISALPGVQAVTLTNSSGSGGVNIEGQPPYPAGTAPQVFFRAASASYRQVAGIPLLQGRWITDDEPSPVLVVNQTLVRRLFGSGDPLGRRLRLPYGSATIVGVVGDLKISRLDADPDAEALIPYKQTPVFSRLDVWVKMRGASPAMLPELRKQMQAIEPTQPPYDVMTLEGALDGSIAPRRFQFLLLGAFAATALVLALIGIYGVMSYAVTQRTGEIGIRMALGAPRLRIVGMMVRQGMAAAFTGIVAGVAAALGLTRLMAALLFEVKPNDPAIFAAVAAALACAALVACCIPALKAARIDPMQTLSCD